MKHLVRAALAALVSVTAAAAAMLPAGPAAASAASAAPAHSSGLNSATIIGTWANNDPTSKSIQNIVVSNSPSGGILVDAFGACVMSNVSTPCEWGNVHAVAFAQVNTAGISKTAGTSFRAEWSWDHGRGRSILVANLMMVNGQPMMIIEEPRIYVHDAKMGSNWIVDEIFHVAGTAVTPTKSGTTVTDNYPTGAVPKPDPNLAGIWMNSMPDNQGIAMFVVSLGRNGTLTVHTYGVCDNGKSVCDWGTTYGVLLGDPAESGQAEEFIAPYKFHGKDVLLCAQIMNAEGTMMMNNEYTDMTDGHGADINNSANHTVDENFMKA